MSEESRWKKTGGGSFRLKSGKIVKPNESFRAKAEDIPKAFRDILIPLDGLPEERPLESKTAFEIRESEEDKKREEGEEISASDCTPDKTYYMVVETGEDEEEEVEVECIRVNQKTVVFKDGEDEEYKIPSEEIVKTQGPEIITYSVVNSTTEKAINKEALDLEEAEELLRDLS